MEGNKAREGGGGEDMEERGEVGESGGGRFAFDLKGDALSSTSDLVTQP